MTGSNIPNSEYASKRSAARALSYAKQQSEKGLTVRTHAQRKLDKVDEVIVKQKAQSRREYQKDWYAKTKLKKQLNNEPPKRKQPTKKKVEHGEKLHLLENELDKLLQKLSSTSALNPQFGELINEMDVLQLKIDNIKKPNK